VVRPGRGVTGRVILSVPVVFGLGRIAPLVPALLERHPRLHLDLRLEDRTVDLLADGVDLAIRAGARPPDSTFVVARRLDAYDRAICASPKLLAAHGPIPSIAALASLPCVVHGAGPATWSFETPSGPQSVVVDGRLRTNNLLVVHDAVLAGAGLGCPPPPLVDSSR
jgi:DNA-binding transcriptional LysR family regulator